MQFVQHELCGSRTFLLSGELGAMCHHCEPPQRLNTQRAVSVPSPFVGAEDVKQRFAVLIKPTNGDFLRSYKPGDDLHIGISLGAQNSVSSYWTKGLQTDDVAKWHGNALELLALDQIAPDRKWEHEYRQFVRDSQIRQQFSSANYRDANNNCYDFVLAFLQQAFPDEPVFTSKDAFAAEFVQSRLCTAYKYISVYRQCVASSAALDWH